MQLNQSQKFSSKGAILRQFLLLYAMTLIGEGWAIKVAADQQGANIMTPEALVASEFSQKKTNPEQNLEQI